MKKLIILFLFFASGAFFTGCPENPVKPDPCEVYKNGKSQIVMSCSLLDTAISETTIPIGYINFDAKGIDYTEWNWKIGEDTTTYTNKKFTLFFDKNYGDVPITLIAKRAPITNCDNGIDTAIATLHMIYWPDSKIFGKYRGIIESEPLDTFVVEINYTIDSYNQIALRLNNVPKGFYDTCKIGSLYTSLEISNNAIQFKSNDTWEELNFYGSTGLGVLEANTNRLNIVFTTIKPGYDGKKLKFRGVRL